MMPPETASPEETVIIHTQAAIVQSSIERIDQTIPPLLRREVEATCDWKTIVRHPRRRELFEAVANDPGHEVGIYEMLEKAQVDVAVAAKDLQIGHRSEHERQEFINVVGKYSDYMREVLWFEIGQIMTESSAGYATRQAITHVRTSHASIIKREGEERLAHSHIEQFKETVAATPKRRFTGRVAIGLAQFGVPVLVSDYVFNQILPEEAQEAVLSHINTENLAAIAVALVYTGLKAGTKFGSDNLLERLSKTFSPYKRSKPTDADALTEETELIYSSQVEHQKQLLIDLNGFMASEKSGENPYSEAFVDGLVGLVVIALRNEYLDEERGELGIRIIRGAGRSATIGAVRLLGFSDPEAEEFADTVFEESDK